MTLFLRNDEVDQCVTMEAMLEAIETMQKRYGQGEAYNLGRRKIIADTGMLSVMGGGLFYDGVLGVKTYTVVRGSYSFQVSLYDASTGKLLCYLQANRLGQLRTGATTGVAVKHLSRNAPLQVGIIGTGGQAPTQLQAVASVRDIAGVKAFSRNPERRAEFAARTSDSLGLKVKAADSNEDAVRDSDLVIGIAATAEPVVKGSWLKQGATVIGAGPTTWRVSEVDDETLTRADKLFVDSLDQVSVEAGDIAAAVDRGLLNWSQLSELRHAVCGAISGRDNDGQIVYAKLMGTGVADVAAAKLAYDSAREQGLGTEMDW
jgi:ornithine cyclodeaminase/alanine dehydrogenase-like protein (mu-crystallin family)